MSDETITMELQCDLTDDEVLERSNALVAALHKIAILEEQRKREASQTKSEIERTKAEADELARAVRNRSEEREVECWKSVDYHQGTVTTYRYDTGERVSMRHMTAAERQRPLQLVINPKEARRHVPELQAEQPASEPEAHSEPMADA